MPKSGRGRLLLKGVLPPVVLGLGLALTAILAALKPEAEKKEPEPVHPKIETFTVEAGSETVRVISEGTVQPLQETRLSAQVAGDIVWVADNFYPGSQFGKDEVLLRLDPLPFESALAEAKSRLALQRTAYLQELENAEQARRDWRRVGSGEASPLVLREPQLEKAKADLAAAKVAVRMAEDNLADTRVRAPYDGRVRDKYVEIGQSIAGPSLVLGDVYATRALEVPLPLSLDDLALLGFAGPGNPPTELPEATLATTIGNRKHRWEAQLVRTAAAVNPRTRMITAYARVESPFTSNQGWELTPGMFVEAVLTGPSLPNAFRIPRSTLQPGNIVYRLTDGDRLEEAEVTVLRSDEDSALVAEGLSEGDRLCRTPLLFFVDGMRVESTP